MLTLLAMLACPRTEDSSASEENSVPPAETGDSACTPQSETCNGVDDDCDGEIDNILVGSEYGAWPDYDGDGYGAPPLGDPMDCSSGTVVTNGDDCDDDDAAIHPGAEEDCGGADRDCDRQIEADGALGCLPGFLDSDGDGVGGSTPTCPCADPVLSSSDCDDANPRFTDNCSLDSVEDLDWTLRIDDGFASSHSDCTGDGDPDLFTWHAWYSFPESGRYTLDELLLIESDARFDVTGDGVCDVVVIDDNTWLDGSDRCYGSTDWLAYSGLDGSSLVASVTLDYPDGALDACGSDDLGTWDVDGDGRDEIVRGSYTGSLYVFDLDGTAPQEPDPVSTYVLGMDWSGLDLVGDLDGDGEGDTLQSWWHPSLPGYVAYDARLDLLAVGGWTDYGVLPDVYGSFATGDADGSGTPDLTYADTSGAVWVVDPPHGVVAPEDVVVAHVASRAPAVVWYKLVADFDEDGREDLLVDYTWPDGEDLVIWRGPVSGELTLENAWAIYRFDGVGVSGQLVTVDAPRGVALTTSTGELWFHPEAR